jgi:hypothetical protein
MDHPHAQGHAYKSGSVRRSLVLAGKHLKPATIECPPARKRSRENIFRRIATAMPREDEPRYGRPRDPLSRRQELLGRHARTMKAGPSTQTHISALGGNDDKK